VIGINTQACNDENWYLIANRYDPGAQLKFIADELAKLEAVGGSAILISHIPPRYCLHAYGERFRSITERYQHVIKFSLYGHTHREMFSIARSYADNKNIGINYVTGSLTMSSEYNPTFSVVEIDEEFMVPINFKIYVMDLGESNKQKTPIFRLQSDFLQTYNIPDVSPNALYTVSEKILNDEETATLYWWNEYRQYGDKPASCDAACRQ
jgi:hypothetical protein